MLGTIVNCAAILLGGAAGLLLRGRLSQSASDSVMSALGLCVLYIGISGSLQGDQILLAVISMALGTLAGEALGLEAGLDRAGARLEQRFAPKNHAKGSFAQGFVTASLLYCVGAMAVVGSLESGLNNNHSILFTKSLIDGITAVFLASTLGAGVLLSALPILIYQGGITLVAAAIAPLLSDPVINNVTMVGSLLIIGLGLNMLKVCRLRVANMLPALLIPLLWGLLDLF